MQEVAVEDRILARKLLVAARASTPAKLRQCAGVEEHVWLMGSFCAVRMPALWQSWVAAAPGSDAQLVAYNAIVAELDRMTKWVRPCSAEDDQRAELGGLTTAELAAGLEAACKSPTQRSAEEQRRLDAALRVAAETDAAHKSQMEHAAAEAAQVAAAAVARRKAVVINHDLTRGHVDLWHSVNGFEMHLRVLADGQLRLPQSQYVTAVWVDILRAAADVMVQRSEAYHHVR